MCGCRVRWGWGSCRLYRQGGWGQPAWLPWQGSSNLPRLRRALWLLALGTSSFGVQQSCMPCPHTAAFPHHICCSNTTLQHSQLQASLPCLSSYVCACSLRLEGRLTHPGEGRGAGGVAGPRTDRVMGRGHGVQGAPHAPLERHTPHLDVYCVYLCHLLGF